MARSQSVDIDTSTTISTYLNTNSGNNTAESDSSTKSALETQLADSGSGLTARVIHLNGNRAKIKFYKNNKPVGIYKSRSHTLAKAMGAREYFRTNNLAGATVASIEVTAADDTPTHPTTTQLTVTATFTGGGTADVTSRSSFSSSVPAKATVNSSGLVTTIAAGATVITATYGDNTDDLTVTVE